MADLDIIFLRRKHTIHWYQSLFTVITGSMPFRYFWATLYRHTLPVWRNKAIYFAVLFSVPYKIAFVTVLRIYTQYYLLTQTEITMWDMKTINPMMKIIRSNLSSTETSIKLLWSWFLFSVESCICCHFFHKLSRFSFEMHFHNCYCDYVMNE